MRDSIDPSTRRAALLDAASRVFAEKGLASATVADVAAAASVSKGSVYLWFASKDEMVAALENRYLEGLAERARQLFERVGSEDLWSLTDELIAEVIDYDLEHRDVMVVVAAQPPETDSGVGDGEADLLALLGAGIQIGVTADEVDVPDIPLTANMLVNAVHGTTVRLLVNGDHIDRDVLVTTAQVVARRILGGHA